MSEGAAAVVRYDAAKNEIAKTGRVADAKTWRDKAVAMQTYAKEAQDCALIDQATDIRLHAEIRAGELLAEMKVNGTRQKPGDKVKARAKSNTDTKSALEKQPPSLPELGISHKQSSRWQKLAALPRAEQEAIIEHAQKRARAAIEGGRWRKKKLDDDADTGPEFEMTRRAMDLALRVRDLVLEEARKMRPVDRTSVLLALRYEARDMPKLFVREFGKTGDAK